MIDCVYGHVKTVRPRSAVAEYRVEDFQELAEVRRRLPLRVA